MREQELILYRSLLDDELFRDMAWLMTEYANEYYNTEDKKALLFECFHGLVDFGVSHGFYGNLWHCYLANLMVNSENALAVSAEIRTSVDGSLKNTAMWDYTILKELFGFSFAPMGEALEAAGLFEQISDFVSPKESGKVYNTRIRDRIVEVAQKLGAAAQASKVTMATEEGFSSAEEAFWTIMTDFYRDYGVGRFGLHKAFRIEHTEEGAQIAPILNIQHVKLEDLVGYESAKARLVENTEAFLAGRRANNVLLYGEAGTGKSSSIKAICNRYYDQGLRIIEVYKHQFQDLNDIISQIKGRNYKFILYMDDLSFEEFEIEYKYLKAVIEGGLEKKPANVLIYATSNRRHLVRESFRDREEAAEDLHRNDTVQEKLSLASRFGVSIYFTSPAKKEFEEIVLALAKRHHVEMSEEELLLGANRWELSNGGMSGRTAQQYIDYLLGKESL